MVFLLILVLVAIGQLYAPWWSMAVVCWVVAALLGRRFFATAMSAFLAVFFVWAIKAFITDLQNEQLLSARVAAMMGLPQVSEWLFLLTALLGALLAFMAASAGYATRRLFAKSAPKQLR